jgi:hypothetical protein
MNARQPNLPVAWINRNQLHTDVVFIAWPCPSWHKQKCIFNFCAGRIDSRHAMMLTKWGGPGAGKSLLEIFYQRWKRQNSI